MPTICLDCRYIRNRPSGIGRVVQALVDHLPSLAPDLDFRFLRHRTHPGPLSTAANARDIPVGFESNGPTSMWRLPQRVDLRDVDLFHAPSNILPHGLAMPCVTTIHDLMWLDHPQWCNPGLWGQVERRFYRHGIGHALRHSNAILAVSDATRDAIIARDSALAERTVTARPGVSEDFAPRPADPARLARRGLREAGYILTVGQFAPYKNHDNALRGFARAFADRGDIVLVLVQRRGSGSTGLARLAASLGVADRVRFLPPMDDSELAALYHGALALLHPSLCEGFGLPLVEAMASGCPVVTSDLSAMPEVTGGAALLVDPGDTGAIAAALHRVVEDQKLAADLKDRGLKRAQDLRWEDFAKANLALYREVLAEA
ncbi:glycosyltransferase family 1 protein [Citromicrobium bathyomarinum]|uniref:glycosyltransferase family 4 protein n=1 Tax=Citromicrobium bathyomarinum TaxID=72174 RepID=UPI00315A78ED